MDLHLVQERDVEGYLRDRVGKLGGRCEKFNSVSGWPDRIVLLPGGVVFWVETKRPKGGVVSPAQRVAHEQLRRLGQRVELVYTKEQADKLLAEYQKTPV